MNEHMKEFVRNFVIPKKKHLEIVLLSPTAGLQDTLHWMAPYVILHRETINETIAAEVYDKCWENLEKNKKSKLPVELFIIVDDLGENSFQKRKQNDNPFKMLATNIAHYKHCHLVFLLQRLVQAAVVLRDNSDYIYCFKLENLDEKKNFYKWFCGDLEKIDFNRLVVKAWGTPKRPIKFGYIFIDRHDPQQPKKYYANKELVHF